MAGIYTERFLFAAGGSGAVGWTVPGGHRAIITSVVGLNGGGPGGFVMLSVAGTAVWIHTFQVTNSAVAEAMRVPAYAGEVIGGYSSQLYMTLTVSGYLFRDLAAGLAIPKAEPVDLAELVGDDFQLA